MLNATQYFPPAPTWRLCHPVNIYVYRNGISGEKPQLVHIPMEKKKNMSTVLEAIGSRMKLPVGYPLALYHMDGTRICKSYELDMYNSYVVATNIEKRFKCADYGKVREPLVVIGPYSKHVNTLKFQNKKYDLFCRQKMAKKPLHELITHGQDGLGPENITTGKPCGILCHKINPSRNKPTQCYSDEIMCVEGAAMDLEQDHCRQKIPFNFDNNMPATSEGGGGQMIGGPPGQGQQDYQYAARQGQGQGGEDCGPLITNNLVDLMQRYQEVGSDIFKMFQDKITRDVDSNISSRWNIPVDINSETTARMKEELLKLTQLPCDITFDKHGNFLQSSGCRVGPPSGQEGVLSEAFRLPFTLSQLEKEQGCPVEDNKQRMSAGAGGYNQQALLANIAEVDELNNVSKERMFEAKMKEKKETAGGETPSHSRTSGPNPPAVGRTPSPSEITEAIGQMAAGWIKTPEGINSDPSNPPGGGGATQNQGISEEEKQVFAVLVEQSRNPFAEGFLDRKPTSLVGKFGDERMEALLAENPFRKCFYFGDQTQNNNNNDPFLSKILPPEGFRGLTPATSPTKASSSKGFHFHFEQQDPNNNEVFPRGAKNQGGFHFGDFSTAASRSSSFDWCSPPPLTDINNNPRQRQRNIDFLTQINELVHRHDRTKATSPPPPLPPPPPPLPPPQGFVCQPRSTSTSTFIVDRRKERGQRILGPVTRTRNVCAQVGRPKVQGGLSARSKNDTTQTTFVLPSEDEEPVEVEIDEKPAGLYEGYQDSIQVQTQTSDEDDSGDDERRHRHKDHERRNTRHNCSKRKADYYQKTTQRQHVYRVKDGGGGRGQAYIPNYPNPGIESSSLQGYAAASHVAPPKPPTGPFRGAIGVSGSRPLQFTPQQQQPQLVQRVFLNCPPPGGISTPTQVAYPIGSQPISNPVFGGSANRGTTQQILVQTAPPPRTTLPLLARNPGQAGQMMIQMPHPHGSILKGTTQGLMGTTGGPFLTRIVPQQQQFVFPQQQQLQNQFVPSTFIQNPVGVGGGGGLTRLIRLPFPQNPPVQMVGPQVNGGIRQTMGVIQGNNLPPQIGPGQVRLPQVVTSRVIPVGGGVGMVATNNNGFYTPTNKYVSFAPFPNTSRPNQQF